MIEGKISLNKYIVGKAININFINEFIDISATFCSRCLADGIANDKQDKMVITQNVVQKIRLGLSNSEDIFSKISCLRFPVIN
jgi:hypothetical protein